MMVETTDVEKLLAEFQGDNLEDLVRFLTDVTSHTDDRVKRRAMLYWIRDGCLWQYNHGTGDAIRVRADQGGLQRAKLAHEVVGHQGRDVTIRAIREVETWADLRYDVQKAIQSCRTCSQFGPRVKNHLLRPLCRYEPFATIAMDYLSLPQENGHKHVLVAVDRYSRFVFAWPVKGHPNAKSTIEALQWLERHFMAPKELLSDGGKHLESLAVRRWLLSRGSYITIAAAHTHVGVAEAAVKLVIDRIRKLSGQDLQALAEPSAYTANWVGSLEEAVAVINNRKLDWLRGYVAISYALV
jgi:hypothetical protein